MYEIDLSKPVSDNKLIKAIYDKIMNGNGDIDLTKPVSNNKLLKRICRNLLFDRWLVYKATLDGSAMTAQFSGPLIAGHEYIIASYGYGDKFTNAGASSDASGVVFIANGNQPQVWTHGSKLIDRTQHKPKVCVLNGDDPNFVNLGVWKYHSEYVLELTLDGEIPQELVMFSTQSPNDDAVTTLGFDPNDASIIRFVTNMMYDYRNYPIEISIRQRGESPSLLRAETNEFGDTFYLFFNKKMSINSGISGLSYSINGESGNGFGNMEIVDNQIILSELDEYVGSGDAVTLRFDEGGDIIESADMGLLQALSDFPVTNNVPVLALLSAETSGDGLQIRFTFDRMLPNCGYSFDSMNIYRNGVALIKDEIYTPGDPPIVLFCSGDYPVLPTDIITADVAAGFITSVEGYKFMGAVGIPVTNKAGIPE